MTWAPVAIRTAMLVVGLLVVWHDPSFILFYTPIAIGAFTAPRTWVAGELVTASMGNTHWRDNLIALRAGEISVASQASLDDIFAGNASQLVRLAVGTKYQVTRLNNAGTTYERAAPNWLRAFDDVQASTGANTTETVLYTFSANSNLLNVNGRTLRLRAAGSLGANGNTKTVRVRWGGIGGSIVATTLGIAVNGQFWLAEAYVTRIALDSQRISGHVIVGTQASLGVQMGTAAQTESGVITLVVTGQNGTAAAGDIVYECAWVEQLGAPS